MSGDLKVKMDEIMETEVANIMKALKNNKAARCDQILAQLLKCGKTGTITALIRLLNACWQEEHVCVPEEWR